MKLKLVQEASLLLTTLLFGSLLLLTPRTSHAAQLRDRKLTNYDYDYDTKKATDHHFTDQGERKLKEDTSTDSSMIGSLLVTIPEISLTIEPEEILDVLNPLPVSAANHRFAKEEPSSFNTNQAMPGMALVATYPSFKFSVDSTNIPASPMGAAGPQSLVAVINQKIGINDKMTGGLLSSLLLQEFFQPFSGTIGPYEPKVVYDKHADRFVVVASAGNRTTTAVSVSKSLIAVSKTNNPTSLNSTDWYFNEIDTCINGNWGNHPGWEVDANYVYLTLNMYTAAGSNVESRLWAITKSFYAGAPLTFQTSPSPTYIYKTFSSVFGPFAQTTTIPAEIRGNGLWDYWNIYCDSKHSK